MTANTTAAPRVLRPIAGRGWRLGFGNMLANEFGRWFGTRRWLIQLAVFVLLINGPVFIVSAAGAETGLVEGVAGPAAVAAVADVFGGLLIASTTIGVVVIAQGAIIGEKQLGTAAWVMSKPASRSGFILAKFLAYGVALLLLAFPLPGALFYAGCVFFFGQGPALGALAAMLGLVALHLAFYLALSLMLGTLFAGRGPVAAIGIGLLLFGLSIGRQLPVLPYILPWSLPDLGIGSLMGQTWPPAWPIPVIATAVWIIGFMAVALWRFSREEF